MATTSLKPYVRKKDLTYIARCIESNSCCAIIGLSNMGKSTLLRQIRQPGMLSQFTNADDQDFGFFYVDFNLQLQMTGQGFYELILRTILNQLNHLEAKPDLIRQVKEAYELVVAPTDEFQNALSFNQAIIALCENWSRRLVLLFDEFDEVFHGIDARVFLNLRALRDRYPSRLLYVVVACKRLFEYRDDAESSEFAELFAHANYYVTPLDDLSVTQIAKNFAAEANVTFTDEDMQFIITQSGGHPGLLEAICQVLSSHIVEGGDRRLVLSHLSDNLNVRVECAKLWHGISEARQKALVALLQTGDISLNYQRALVRKGIVVEQKNNKLKIFSKLFENFIHRQQIVQQTSGQGLVIDIESGEVYIEGIKTALLTGLEYRLLLLLYEQINKICDKYSIVEAVWGEDYIEEVDDARIEKLISRLRQKIEPNPSEPKYLVTIRGRGYRLQNK